MELLKHECGVAMIRLRKPLEYYKEKYGTWMYGLNKLYLLMEKQHNRGQEGAGMACVKLDMPAGTEFMFRERAEGSGAISELFNAAHSQIARLPVDKRDDAAYAKEHAAFAGEIYMGHLRYSTTGKSGLSYVHPFMRRHNYLTNNLLLCGNFNLTNVDEVFEMIVRQGQHPRHYADTFIILEQIGHRLDREVDSLYDKAQKEYVPKDEVKDYIQRNIRVENVLKECSPVWDGGYVICGITGSGESFALRDPWGIRPAFYYIDDEIIVLALVVLRGIAAPGLGAVGFLALHEGTVLGGVSSDFDGKYHIFVDFGHTQGLPVNGVTGAPRLGSVYEKYVLLFRPQHPVGVEFAVHIGHLVPVGLVALDICVTVAVHHVLDGFLTAGRVFPGRFHNVYFDAVRTRAHNVVGSHTRTLVGHKPERRPYSYRGRSNATHLEISVLCGKAFVVFAVGYPFAVGTGGRLQPRRVPAFSVLSVLPQGADGERPVGNEERIRAVLVIRRATHAAGITRFPFGVIHRIPVEFVREYQLVSSRFEYGRYRFFFWRIGC